MSRYYFLSDVHLGVGSREVEHAKESRFVQLLRDIRLHGVELFIVGDLFDFWFEYAHVVPRGYHRVLTALQDLVQDGIHVTLLAGNHDFAIGSVLERDCGVSIITHDLTRMLEEKSFYLYHGDGLSEKDLGYRLMKRVIRSRPSMFFFRWLHPDIGFSLAKLFSHSSRDYTSKKHFGESDGMIREAERRIAAGHDFVIMGHRHVPTIKVIGHGTYVNLGDWLVYNTYAIFEEGNLDLYTLQNGISVPFTPAL